MSSSPIKLEEKFELTKKQHSVNSPNNMKLNNTNNNNSSHNISSGLGDCLDQNNASDDDNFQSLKMRNNNNINQNPNSSNSFLNSSGEHSGNSGPIKKTIDNNNNENNNDTISVQKMNIKNHRLFPVLQAIFRKCQAATNGKLEDVKDASEGFARDKHALFKNLQGVKFDKKNELDKLVSTISQIFEFLASIFYNS